jgi:hypothetical protein
MQTDEETVNQTQEGNIIENETEIEQPTYKEVSDVMFYVNSFSDKPLHKATQNVGQLKLQL